MPPRISPISFDDIKAVAETLNVLPCAVRAVVEVESGGSGFLPDGRVKILFEAHVFWRELKARGIDPAGLAEEHPSILSPTWDRTKYRGGAGEWDRMAEAIGLNEEAALCSASWGLFQIMGNNHMVCGFATVREFVAAMNSGPAAQLAAFAEFLRARRLVRYLADLDWAGFARGYNGPGYAANRYDVKLRAAFERCSEGVA